MRILCLCVCVWSDVRFAHSFGSCWVNKSRNMRRSLSRNSAPCGNMRRHLTFPYSRLPDIESPTIYYIYAECIGQQITNAFDTTNDVNRQFHTRRKLEHGCVCYQRDGGVEILNCLPSSGSNANSIFSQSALCVQCVVWRLRCAYDVRLCVRVCHAAHIVCLACVYVWE